VNCLHILVWTEKQWRVVERVMAHLIWWIVVAILFSPFWFSKMCSEDNCDSRAIERRAVGNVLVIGDVKL
jgi:hypothetical protein